jgi:hypothetical protein
MRRKQTYILNRDCYVTVYQDLLGRFYTSYTSTTSRRSIALIEDTRWWFNTLKNRDDVTEVKDKYVDPAGSLRRVGPE